MTNEIVLYQPNEQMSLEVKLENETVWLTQQQIADYKGLYYSTSSGRMWSKRR